MAVINTIYYQTLYTIGCNIDHMSKENNSTARNNETNNVYEAINQNVTRVVDEVAKAQPQYSQSVSNLQVDYIQAVKNTVQNTIKLKTHN